MTINKERETERRERNWRGGCGRKTRVWRWSIHTLRASMWATVRIMSPCGRIAIQNQCDDSSASQQI